jgi:protein-disulfide isomerase
VNRRAVVIGSVGIALLGLGTWLGFQRHEAAERLERDRWQVPIAAADPVRGPRAASVTLLEFCDFDVAECRAMAPVLARALREFDPDVRWVFKDFTEEATHPRGFVAAHFGRYLFNQGGDAAFWPAHDTMYKVLGGLAEPVTVNLAQKLGLRWEDIEPAVTAEAVAKPLRENVAIAHASGVTAVPYLFINGRPLAGVVSYEALADMIRDELGRAKRLLANVPDVKDPYPVVTKKARVPNPDPRLTAQPARDSEEEEEEEAERRASAPQPVAAHSGSVNPEPTLPALPRVAPKNGTLTVADLSAGDRAELQRRGFEPQAFVGFANTMNEQRRQEDALRADRKAKGFPTEPEPPPKLTPP